MLLEICHSDKGHKQVHHIVHNAPAQISNENVQEFLASQESLAIGLTSVVCFARCFFGNIVTKLLTRL